MAAAVALVAASPSSASTVVRIGSPLKTSPIAPGFVGLALEYPSAAKLAGGSARTINPVFEQLVRNLAPGQRPVIRIGGQSADRTWWPDRRIRRTPGLTFALGRSWIAAIARVTHDLNAELMLGINLEADNPRLAGVEARALVNGIGGRFIRSLQIGNEPSLYSSFPYYRTSSGQHIFSRALTWGVPDYLGQYRVIRQALPRVPLSGPDLGDAYWMGQLDGILRAEPRIFEVTFHRYAGNRCYGLPRTQYYASVANLLGRADSEGLAASIAPYVGIANAHGDGLRVDELNTEACGGKAGVSDTFASALWMLDALFAMAGAGADGVNIQTYPSASYRLFSFVRRHHRWSARVLPDYYGLLMFAQAAPPGAELLHIWGRVADPLRVWATRAGATTRVMLINDSESASYRFRVLAPRGVASVTRLQAPSAFARGHVSLGGESFGARTTTGLLEGASTLTQVRSRHGAYTLRLSPASAALLTIG